MTNDSDSRPTALVVGATGMAGFPMVEYLAAGTDWNVIALARGAGDLQLFGDRVTVVAADLLDRDAVAESLCPFCVTHVFYAAQYRDRAAGKRPINVRTVRRQLAVARHAMPLLLKVPGVARLYYSGIARAAGLADAEKKNLTMMRNLVELVSAPPHGLRHVALVTGGRSYGMHMGPDLYPGWKQPFVEGDPRHPGPSWYFDLEDYLAEHGGAGWTWSVVRPSFLIGFAVRAPQNFGVGLAVYAAMLKEQRLPLLFPGGERNYNCKWEASSAELAARMMHWSATEERCANQVFNCVNGAPFSWSELWPRLAAFFGMETEVPRQPVAVERMFRDKDPLWREMVDKYGLQPFPLNDLLCSEFIDQSMIIDWDVVYSTARARDLGFTHIVDNEDVFVALFERLRAERIIP